VQNNIEPINRNLCKAKLGKIGTMWFYSRSNFEILAWFLPQSCLPFLIPSFNSAQNYQNDKELVKQTISLSNNRFNKLKFPMTVATSADSCNQNQHIHFWFWSMGSKLSKKRNFWIKNSKAATKIKSSNDLWCQAVHLWSSSAHLQRSQQRCPKTMEKNFTKFCMRTLMQ